MTRLAILADLHGNLPALNAVLDDLAQFNVDHVIVAGDVINWGPFSEAVTERVVREGWAVIRGNNEFYLLDYQTPRAPAAWADAENFSMLPWLASQVTRAQHTLIATWPDTLRLCFPDAPPLRVWHGTPRNNREPIYPNASRAELDEKLAGVAEDWVICAHTHLPMHLALGRWQVLNPGSVGVPLAGQLHAQYMLLDSAAGAWTPTFRTVPFSNADVLREFERQQFVERTGIIGHLVVKEFETARLWIHPFLVWRKTLGDPPLTLDLLAEFWRIDPRPHIPEPYRV